MATVKLTSSSSLTQDNTDNFRDVSFSSYLNSTKEVLFPSKISESDPCLSKINSTPDKYQKVETNKAEDGEIGVFSAEKYFNGVMDDNSPRLINSTVVKKCRPKKAQENDPVAPMSTKFHPATPSVTSESSWNSQRALLRSVGKYSSQRKTTGKPQSKRLLAALGCKCSDKESVEVHDQHVGTSFKKSSSTDHSGPEKSTTQKHLKTDLDPEQKSRSGGRIGEDTHDCKSGGGLNKESYFSIPTSNSISATANLNLPTKHHQEIEEIKHRKSLEVFGSQRFEKREDSLSLGRRLTMLSLDAIPIMEEIDVPAAVGGVYNDNESDASSDLFEIDSLTGKINTFLAMQGSDATSAGCRTPVTCYAPSEVSIDWSVVTASAADFSAVSDYEELRPSSTTLSSPIRAFPAGIPRARNETPRRRLPTSLLGCKSDKAVRVAGDAHNTNGSKPSFDQRLSRVSDSYMSLTRLPSESKLTGYYDARSRQRPLASRNLRP